MGLEYNWSLHFVGPVIIAWCKICFDDGGTFQQMDQTDSSIIKFFKLDNYCIS
jgi:hypothetical protein